MKKLSVTSQIVILILTMGIMGVSVGLFGLFKIFESNKNLNMVLDEAFMPFQDFKNTSYIFGSTILLNLEKVTNHELSWETGFKQIEEELAKAEVLLNYFNPDLNLPEELHYFQQVQNNIQQFKIEFNFLKSRSKSNVKIDTDKFSKLIVLINNLHADLEILMSIQMNKASLIQEENKANFTRSIIYFAIILILGVGISMTISLFILIGIKGYIASINRLIQKIASGNLSTVIERRGGKDFGEIHENLRLLSDRFTEILELAQTAANNISVTSEEMSANAQLISSGANQQAGSVEEIAASMEQISSRLQKNTDNTLATQKISSKVVADAKIGSENVKLTVDAIQSIADKISIIGDIAFQTNILALNAAVEAARAGEHGKGFGVVAAEVGKLAERSKTAASEIDTLSQSGVDLILKLRRLLVEFAAEITETSNLISQITEANLEQNTGISEVNTSVQMLNQITQQNAASSEEMATVSEQMSAQAQSLKESIQYFKFQNQEISKNKTQRYLNPPMDENK